MRGPAEAPELARFLAWACERLSLRSRGFCRVRRQVLRRVLARVRDLGIPDLKAYRTLLDDDPAEWLALGQLLRVTVSRFFRDRQVWEFLGQGVLPELAQRALKRGDRVVRAVSVGCASGGG